MIVFGMAWSKFSFLNIRLLSEFLPVLGPTNSGYEIEIFSCHRVLVWHGVYAVKKPFMKWILSHMLTSFSSTLLWRKHFIVAVLNPVQNLSCLHIQRWYTTTQIAIFQTVMLIFSLSLSLSLFVFFSLSLSVSLCLSLSLSIFFLSLSVCINPVQNHAPFLFVLFSLNLLIKIAVCLPFYLSVSFPLPCLSVYLSVSLPLPFAKKI